MNYQGMSSTKHARQFRCVFRKFSHGQVSARHLKILESTMKKGPIPATENKAYIPVLAFFSTLEMLLLSLTKI